jgi:2-haloacid dehalogenase
MTQPAFLFDLGGVLIEWDPRRVYASYFEHPADLERFFAEVCTPDWNRSLDAGRSMAAAVREKQAEFPHLAEPIGWWHSRWEDMLGGAMTETVEVLRDLIAAGHPVHALSNWSAETFPIARARFPFLQWFQHIVISGEVGLTKPDPAIFHLAIERCGLTPEHTLFIDDHPPNVDSARALGFQTHLFTDAGQLRRELETLGVL